MQGLSKIVCISIKWKIKFRGKMMQNDLVIIN